MKKLAILGAGGHAKVVADAALNSGWDKLYFFDDRWPHITSIGPWDIAGDTDILFNDFSKVDGVIVAIGDNKHRWSKISAILNHGLQLATIIHPTATISQFSTVEEGVVIFAHAVINPDSHIKMGTIINTGAIVEHDCNLGKAVHICPGVNLAGNVTIGDFSWIGIGCSIRQGITLGNNVFIGAGAVVISDLADNCSAKGIPAKIYNKQEVA